VTKQESEALGASKAARNRSRGLPALPGSFRRLEPIGVAVLVLGTIAGALLVVAEFSTLFSVKVLTATCEDLADPRLADTCVTKGSEQHSYALVVLGVLAIVMAWGAGAGRSVPAAWALAAVGVVVLAIALIGDFPDSGKTGAVGQSFSEARAEKATGIWLELIGGVLALGAGLMRLVAGRPARAAPPGSRDRIPPSE
jgi:hypothetical protein